MKFDEPEEENDDCLEIIRFCFIDLFEIRFAKLILVIAFINVTGLTILQTYYSINGFSTIQFIKYAPVYFGRFYVLVCLSFILYYRNVTYKSFQKIPLWKFNTAGTTYEKRVKRDALYTKIYVVFIVVTGFCAAVLYVIPTEEDHEIFFIMTWFEDNMLEWADILSLGHRLTFLFVSFLMQAPCLQICYLLKHTEYQLGIIKNLLEHIHYGFENLDEIDFNNKFHDEIKRRLIFCLKRHILFISIGKTIIRDGSIFVFLFAVTGAMLGVSLMLFFFLIEESLTFTYFRLWALIFVAILTSVQYIIQGQSLEDVTDELFERLTRIKWYYWNKENKIIYQILLLNSSTSVSIKFSENVSVNYKLGIDLSKAVYSMMSFMTYIKDSVIAKKS
ncbi:uncharacterized protein LOC123004051 [Tribolium madens]|uniref:uncharacterized protein LOC123004051 n=1 Tax=Tribolium madens TaxID=41895 RepID=UPI001CF72EE7|nr:uncharacterized protein LOC123004051 [Tribolium madens]